MNSKYINKFVDMLIVVFGLGADVVTVTSGSAGNAGSTAAELITWKNTRDSYLTISGKVPLQPSN